MAQATVKQSTIRNCDGRMEHLLTVDDLAKIFKLQRSWVYGRIHRGELPFPYLKIGRYVRFRASDVEAYLESVTRYPDDESTGN